MATIGGASAVPATMSAQEAVSVSEEAVTVSEFTCDNTNRYYSSWRDNWFLQLGAGVNQPFVEHGVGTHSTLHNVDRKKMTVEYNVGVGRWISPYLGLRLNALGGCLHWDNPTNGNPYNGWSKSKHVNLNFELMWDMCNSLAGVNPNRPVSIIPFVGLGGDINWDIRRHGDLRASGSNILKEANSPGGVVEDIIEGNYRTRNWTLPVSAGVQFRFRLCKYVDFFAEARAAFYGDNWNGCAYGSSIESNVSALGGFNINFGGRKWGSYNECATASEIASLNGQVNNLREELLAANQALAAAELAAANQNVTNASASADCPDIPLLSTVRFKINSDVISPEEEVNVYNMAQWLKANPDAKVAVVGYADKDTGTAEYNLALSQRRAEAVADQLCSKYGIARDRLDIRYDGSAVQPYESNDWNRIVLFTEK